MTIKYLFAPALLAALTIGSVNASPNYSEYFVGTETIGSVTFKLSGYCKGAVTLPLTYAPYARIESAPDDSDNYFYAVIDFGNNWSDSIGSDFYAYYTGSSSTLSIQKGNLKFTAKTKAINEGYYPTWYLLNTSLSDATCKDGKTFGQLMNGFEYNPYLQWDSALKHQASFNLQGKQAPFKYSYRQKSSGILEVPQKCKITGDNTYTLATDTYKAVCKLDPVIKLSISTSLKGEMNYD